MPEPQSKPSLKYDHERKSWFLMQKYDWGYLSFEWDGHVYRMWISTGGINKCIGLGADKISLQDAGRLVTGLSRAIETMQFRFDKVRQYQSLWIEK